jgi:hypothetical protein
MIHHFSPNSTTSLVRWRERREKNNGVLTDWWATCLVKYLASFFSFQFLPKQKTLGNELLTISKHIRTQDSLGQPIQNKLTACRPGI